MSHDFFVGYSPTPPPLRRLLVGVTSTILTLALALAALLAAQQRDPGDGQWQPADIVTLRGQLTLSPYPLLQRGDHEPPILLVGEGKRAIASASPHADASVRVRGSLLTRGSWTMMEVLEIEPDSSPLDVVAAHPPHRHPSQTLRGEIIDPKCFTGAMKPGDGKAHKACAALCLRGGIPPAFRVADEPGRLYLLTDAEGQAVRGAVLEELIDFIGEPVELKGAIIEDGAIHRIEFAPGTVRRL